MAHTSPPPKSQWKGCHGPHRRCRNAFLLLGVEGDEHKVSRLQGGVFERCPLTGLSCHSWGTVAAPTIPEEDGTEIQSGPRETIWKKTRYEAWRAWGPSRLLRSPHTTRPEYFPPNPASSEAQGGTGTCGLGSFSGTWH